MSEVLTVLKQKVFEDEARSIAEKKGDWLWNIVFKQKPLSRLDLMYIEYFIVELETTSAPSAVKRLNHKPQFPIVKRLQVLVNGTSGGVALITDRNLEFEERPSEKCGDKIQYSDIDQEESVKRAKVLAHKITHRSMGGMHTAELVSITPIFRPFWVAFYGDVSEGNKVRYITIPADGGQSHRAR